MLAKLTTKQAACNKQPEEAYFKKRRRREKQKDDNDNTLLYNMESVGLSTLTDTFAASGVVDDELDDEFAESISEQAVYGRSKETEALFDAYNSLLSTKKVQIVIIHGESGSGKTVLVDVLRDRLCDENSGYFVTGKYFQNSDGVQEPHSAIMAAFSDLCDLVAQSDNLNDDRLQQVKTILGTDAQILTKSISNLSPFIGEIGDVAIGGRSRSHSCKIQSCL